MARRLITRLPKWLGLLQAILDLATRHEHEFDITISTSILGRTLSLGLGGAGGEEARRVSWR